MDKRQYLKKIISSSTFENAHKLVRLLTYLFDATVENRTLKEIDIAEDFFNRKTDFNQIEDPIVRVNVYKLRKKLDEYYKVEGMADKIKFTIPKRHYSIHFLKRPFAVNVKLQLRILSILLIVLFILTGYLAYSSSSLSNQLDDYIKISSSNPIWNDFLDNRSQTVIALGDHYFYEKIDTLVNREVAVRDYSINNSNEFDELLQRYPQQTLSYKELYFTYFDRSNIWPVPEIYSIIYPYQKNLPLRVASKLTPDEMKQNNIIFLGNVKTIRDFTFFLSFSSITVYIEPTNFSYVPEQSDTTMIIESSGVSKSYHTDYSFIVKVPGPADNYILFLCDLLSTGTSGAVEYISNPEKLQQLENMFITKYGDMPTYFEVVLKTTGFNRTQYDSKVVHHKKIDVQESYSN